MGLIALKDTLGVVPLHLAASEGGAATFDVVSIMTDSVSTVQGQIFGVLAVVVPAIVVITGAIVGIKFGINWLKKLKGG